MVKFYLSGAMDSKKNWFEEWFDSPFYHRLYKHRNTEEAECFITNLVEFLEPPSSSHILDLACGKGRHSIFLNKLGFHVTGLDLSRNSIAAAKKYENDQLRFDVHDMRCVYEKEAFDYVFNLFTSFGYFNSDEENQRVLRAIEKQLKPQGILVLDYLNANKVRSSLIPNEQKIIDGTQFHISRRIEDNRVIKEISFSDGTDNYKHTEQVELITREHFETYLNATSLQIIHTFGGYNLDEYEPNHSPRLILVAKKVN